MTLDPKYQRAYERKRRDRCRARGICITCGRRKRKAGLRSTGTPYTNCQRCIDRHARHATASKLAIRRRERLAIERRQRAAA